ncbi:predicted protein [Chaetomium globosum CBS 148.51]|uniref:Uncharacterized protein n=1 Tax=Chaetomium globosum (strain ATCC 6205 / CBS 148.51 / DSM 1962 / NBRC 6347 / NRRL 1970) TaxID=306901 RepID=Q2H1J3_CHAGB|nr:uncharacterized protein CHGG_04353 [Chaetomium globosum CBS 148.51]EAQ87734.1 predicted protein [Chaetomium globosum CBS 148.51]
MSGTSGNSTRNWDDVLKHGSALGILKPDVAFPPYGGSTSGGSSGSNTGGSSGGSSYPSGGNVGSRRSPTAAWFHVETQGGPQGYLNQRLNPAADHQSHVTPACVVVCMSPRDLVSSGSSEGAVGSLACSASPSALPDAPRTRRASRCSGAARDYTESCRPESNY